MNVVDSTGKVLTLASLQATQCSWWRLDRRPAACRHTSLALTARGKGIGVGAQERWLENQHGVTLLPRYAVENADNKKHKTSKTLDRAPSLPHEPSRKSMEPHVPGSLGRAVPSPVTLPRTNRLGPSPFLFIASTAGFKWSKVGWANGLAFTGNYGIEFNVHESHVTLSLGNRSHTSVN